MYGDPVARDDRGVAAADFGFDSVVGARGGHQGARGVEAQPPNQIPHFRQEKPEMGHPAPTATRRIVMQQLKFRRLPGPYAIMRLAPKAAVPAWATEGEFTSITR